jgi:hypothetical protein
MRQRIAENALAAKLSASRGRVDQFEARGGAALSQPVAAGWTDFILASERQRIAENVCGSGQANARQKRATGMCAGNVRRGFCFGDSHVE